MDQLAERLIEIQKPVQAVNDLDIPQSLVVDLIYRLLFGEGDVSVGRFAEVIRVHPQLLDEIMARLKQEHMVEIAKAGALGRFSYTYRLTEEGTKRAREAMERSQYLGPIPVSLDKYSEAILLQTRETRFVGPKEVQRALRSLVLPDNFHRRIGPAINAGSSLFLYGPPGNGKTTIAEVIAAETGSFCIRINAVMSNVAELRDVLKIARSRPVGRHHRSGPDQGRCRR